MVALALGLVVTACGDDDAGPPPPGDRVIEVDMGDFFFEPENLTLRAGTEVTIDAINVGELVHNFVVLPEGQQVDTAVGLDRDTFLFFVQAPSRASESARFTVPPPGTYQIVCTIAGHLEAGMGGTLTVEG